MRSARIAAAIGLAAAALAGARAAWRSRAMDRWRANMARSSTPGPGVYERLATLTMGGLYRRIAADLRPLAAGADVLEVGCGPGHLAVELARGLPDVRLTASDLDPEMIARADRRLGDANLAGRVATGVADVAALPYADASFDLVYSVASMHHWPDREAGLRQLYRVLRPGGQAVIYDIADPIRRWEDRRASARIVAGATPFAGATQEPFRWPGRVPLFARLELHRPPTTPPQTPIDTQVGVPAPPAHRRRRVRACVGLGANVGDPPVTLAAAVAALAALPGVSVTGVSRLYVTRPVGLVDQPDFHNAAVALDMPAGPDPATGAQALLLALKGIERALGRADRGRWGPRELDLDLLLYGRARLSVERPAPEPPIGGVRDRETEDAREALPRALVVPHPAAHDRLFVLAPLADLAPDLRPPGWTETVEAARARRELVEGADAVRVTGRWDPASGRWVGEG